MIYKVTATTYLGQSQGHAQYDLEPHLVWAESEDEARAIFTTWAKTQLVYGHVPLINFDEPIHITIPEIIRNP